MMQDEIVGFSTFPEAKEKANEVMEKTGIAVDVLEIYHPSHPNQVGGYIYVISTLVQFRETLRRDGVFR